MGWRRGLQYQLPITLGSELRRKLARGLAIENLAPVLWMPICAELERYLVNYLEAQAVRSILAAHLQRMSIPRSSSAGS